MGMTALIQPPKRRPGRSFAGHAADGGLGHDHGIAEGHGQDDIDQQENAAAVLGGQVGKAPDVPQADGRACGGQDKADLAGKGTSLMFAVIHDVLLSLSHRLAGANTAEAAGNALR